MHSLSYTISCLWTRKFNKCQHISLTTFRWDLGPVIDSVNRASILTKANNFVLEADGKLPKTFIVRKQASQPFFFYLAGVLHQTSSEFASPPLGGGGVRGFPATVSLLSYVDAMVPYALSPPCLLSFSFGNCTGPQGAVLCSFETIKINDYYGMLRFVINSYFSWNSR